MNTRATARPKRRTRGSALPPEIDFLYRHGHLYAEDAHAHGWLPVMTCVLCQADVDLLLTHGPYTDAELRDPTRVISLVWDQDVAVLCRCCSRPNCSHRVLDTRPMYHDGGSAT